VFWGLDASLAYRRHFPAINWLLSYSLYLDRLDKWINENVARDWNSLRTDTMKILQEESELEEIVRLVGVDALSPSDRLTLESAKSIREDYLHQNAFHEVDTYTSLNKQYRMLKLILEFYYKGKKAIEAGVSIKDLFELPVRERIGRAKYTPEDQVESSFNEIENELNNQIEALISKEVH
jgi:V/A-type H+-transporting ATPase subunit A